MEGIGILLSVLLLIVAPVVMIWAQRKDILSLRQIVAYWQSQYAAAKKITDDTMAALSEVQRREVLALRDNPQPLKDAPEGILPILELLRQKYPDDRYTVALGWEVVKGVVGIVAVSLFGNSPIKSGHMLLTAETDMGKDTLAYLIAMLLCLRLSPHELQVFWMDGKGADAFLWKGKAHNWREPVCDKDGVAPAMKALRQLREERQKLLQEHQVLKWEDLPANVRPPMIWVYVSEISLLDVALRSMVDNNGKPIGETVEDWLGVELAAARAGGIRYCIGIQDAANWETRWRRQIGCFIAGPQSSSKSVEPNVGTTVADILEAGAIPPHKLPGPGYFTIRVRTSYATVHAPWISLDERKHWLSQLPSRDAVVPAPVGDTMVLQEDAAIALDVQVGNMLRTASAGRKRPADLLAEGMRLADLVNHPDVIAAVLEAYFQLQPGSRKSRQITALVFAGVPGNAHSGTRWTAVVKPILDRFELKIDSAKSGQDGEADEAGLTREIEPAPVLATRPARSIV